MKDAMEIIPIRKVRLFIVSAGVLLVLFTVSGCGSLISSAASDIVSGMSRAMRNNDDLKTVEQGTPACLLMIDGFLESSPDNESLLISGANLYSSYTMFVDDSDRRRRLARKGLQYGLRAVCVKNRAACGLRDRPFDEFAETISNISISDAPAYYALGASWAAWIAEEQGNWDAVAEISRVEAVMEKIVELDDLSMHGGAHMYLGVINSLLPAALGGRPEEGRGHFEKAAALSKDNLMVKVLFAKHYARTMFDRELHDRLLKAVIEADPNTPGLVTNNLMAQQKARELLSSADDYF